MQDSIDGGTNRHLDLVPRRAAPAPPAPSPRLRRPGGVPAMWWASGRALAERHAERAVARQRAVAGQHRGRPGRSGRSASRAPAPIAWPSRAISAKPRVISAAAALRPSPRPSTMPAAMASTFLTAPPSATPSTSWSSRAGRRRPPASRPASRPRAASAGGDADRRRQTAHRLLGEARSRQHGDAAGRAAPRPATSGISSPLAASMPLAQITTGAWPGRPRAERAHGLRRADQQQRRRRRPSAARSTRRLDAGRRAATPGR